MQLQSSVDELQLELGNTKEAADRHLKTVNDKMHTVNEYSSMIENLKTENLSLRNDVSLLKSKVDNYSETSKREYQNLSTILTSNKQDIGDKDEEINKLRILLDTKTLE
jgi:phage host-nuclease inhibitor protein Gam